MCPGLSDDLQQIDYARKTTVISRELKSLNIDTGALQETRHRPLYGCQQSASPSQANPLQKGCPHINTAMTSVSELRERFADTIQEALSDCLTSCADER